MHEVKRFTFLQNNKETIFQDFLKKVFILPYLKPRIIAELYNKKYDYIIRIDNLQEDFSIVLQKLGLKQVRPVS